MDMKELFKELYVEKFGEKINTTLAESIVEDMAVTDGSTRECGEKWTFEQSLSMGDKVSVDWNKVNQAEWYLVLNMMYSDHYRTGKKYGLQETFYADLAYDWFNDKDGKKDKTFDYFINL